MRKDIWKAVDAFYRNGHFVKSLNSTFIALIPKRKGAVEVKDFRPISLLGSVYKIISKLLTERFKTVISKLVSPNQNAFIKGRQISDASMVANENLDNLMRRKKKGLACKLDLEKAYDHVNWQCLLNLLRLMNFEEKWIDWVKFCISTVKSPFLLMKTPKVFSVPSIRQGDPCHLICL